MKKNIPSQVYELDARRLGFKLVAGVDEVGRGCLAGPVIAAAVILPLKHTIVGLRDSKLLTPAKREVLYQEIYRQAQSIGIGSVDAPMIDEINILKASMLAMKKAVEALRPIPDFLLVDGNMADICSIPQQSIVKGDRLSESIAAASIVAKVFRDSLMKNYDETYPNYGFSIHKGYPTEQHVQAIRLHGASQIHRKTFQGVK